MTGRSRMPPQETGALRRQHPAVTALIPHYGDPSSAQRLITALKVQSYQGQLRIVVIDDASPDPFPETEDVDVLRRGTNGGFGSAVNTGMQTVGTDLAFVLNSDLEIGPTFISDMLTAAAPWQPAVLSPQIYGHDGKPQGVGRHFTTTSHQVIEWLTPLARFRHLTVIEEAVGHDTRCTDGSVMPVDWVLGAAMLVPVTEFNAVGGFDERFFMNAEEVDLQLRLRQRSIPSVFVGTVTATHEGGGSSQPTQRRQWLVDSRLSYARKWGSEGTLRTALRSASLLNFIFNTLREATGRDINARSILREELSYLARKSQ